MHLRQIYNGRFAPFFSFHTCKFPREKRLLEEDLIQELSTEYVVPTYSRMHEKQAE